MKMGFGLLKFYCQKAAEEITQRQTHGTNYEKWSFTQRVKQRARKKADSRIHHRRISHRAYDLIKDIPTLTPLNFKAVMISNSFMHSIFLFYEQKSLYYHISVPSLNAGWARVR